MGGAAFIALKGCDSSADDNDGDGVFYASPQACVDDGNSAQVCSDAWNNAKAKFEADMPKNMSGKTVYVNSRTAITTISKIAGYQFCQDSYLIKSQRRR